MTMITQIVSSFNRAEGLARSLRSVMNQEGGYWPNYVDLIICDDCSTDPKVHELLNEVEKRGWGRVIRGESKTVEQKKHFCTFTDLINRAMDMSKGNYFSYLTDGDEYMPQRYINYASYLDSDPETFLVWGMCRNIRDGVCEPMPKFGKMTKAWIMQNLPNGNFIDHNTVMHRKTELRWDTSSESWKFADWFFWLKMIGKNYKFSNTEYVGEVLYRTPDSLGRCLVERHEAFELMYERKCGMRGNAKIEEIKKEASMEGPRKILYAMNKSNKIQIVNGESFYSGDLVLASKVTTPDGRIFPDFQIVETEGYEPKDPQLPDWKPVESKGPKVPFERMKAVVEAAKAKAEEMEKK